MQPFILHVTNKFFCYDYYSDFTELLNHTWKFKTNALWLLGVSLGSLQRYCSARGEYKPNSKQSQCFVEQKHCVTAQGC